MENANGYRDRTIFVGSVMYKVGQGATIHIGSDSYACTVIAETRCTVTVREDSAIVVSGHAHAGDAVYRFESNADGCEWKFRQTKNGWKDVSGARLTIGNRHEYRNPSF